MMRTLIWILGLLAIGLGTALAVAPSPTGAVVGTSAELTTFWSLILVVGGVLGITMTGLEDRVERDAQVRSYWHHLRREDPTVTYEDAQRRFNAEMITRHTPARPALEPAGPAPSAASPRVFISNKALMRFGSDAYVNEHAQRYHEEIARIIESQDALGARQTERIGKFNVSPLGRSTRRGIRVAWHVEHIDGKSVICIDDLLYHEKEGKYVDNWNTKARHGDVTPESYTQRIPYELPKKK